MLSENIISEKSFSDHIRSGFFCPISEKPAFLIPFSNSIRSDFTRRIFRKYHSGQKARILPPEEYFGSKYSSRQEQEYFGSKQYLGIRSQARSTFPAPSLCLPIWTLPPSRQFMCCTRCLYPCPFQKLLMMLGTGTRHIVPGSTRVAHRPCARQRLLLLYGCNIAPNCTLDRTR